MAGPQKAQQSHGKQEDYVKEISDLQETLEWKDKRIRVQLLSVAMFHEKICLLDLRLEGALSIFLNHVH